MRGEVGKDTPVRTVHRDMRDIFFAALSNEEMRFQVNDHVVHFGAIVRVEEVRKQDMIVRHIGKGYPQHPFTVGKAFAARQRRGFWLGDREPEHRVRHDIERGCPQCEPYVFSHFASGTAWQAVQPELDARQAAMVKAA